MTRREKRLAIVIGGLLLLIALGFGYRKLSSMLQDRRRQIAALEKQVADKRRIVRFSRPAADRMQVYERKSLPADLEKARSLYQTWLLNTVTEVGLKDAQVNAQPHRAGKLYQMLTFTVNGQGDIRQLTGLLHRFYAADYLHRIRRLHVKRIENSRQLDLAIAIEALSLPTAANLDQLSQHPSGRLAHGELDAYLQGILARNLSGPANQPPTLESIGSKSAYAGETVSFDVSGKDPDKLDRVTYSLVESTLPGAALDARSGRFSGRAERTGEYRVVVAATDDGFPPKSQTQQVRITVNDRPPPEPPRVESTPKPKPSFALARFAFVTAITEVDGRRQVWISLRTEGKIEKIHEGEQLQVGEVPVTVRQIEDKSVVLEAAVLEKRFRVQLGQNLAEGSDLSGESKL